MRVTISTHDSPATYGGPGWRSRHATHADDVRGGVLWRTCGARSEVGALAEVLLARPVPAMFGGGSADDALLFEWPDVRRLERQAQDVAAFYESRGVTVSWAESHTAGAINFLFQRDLFVMTPEGAVLGRPASRQRAGDARDCAAALAGLGVPILATPRDEAWIEGADALWLDARTMIVGVGHRTNVAGARFLSRVLAEMGVDTVQVAMPAGVQHLLGVVNIVDRDLAVVRAGTITAEIAGRLKDARLDLVPIPRDPRDATAFGMNFVTLAPRRVVMPAGHDAVRTRLAEAGIDAATIEVDEYLKAAGGLGCLTGILRRLDSGSAD
jgi:N-dimethylarginine dimethylaminohydrolase